MSQISDAPLFSRQQASPVAKMERMWVLKINTSVILVVLLFSAFWGVLVMELLSIESSKLCGSTNQKGSKACFGHNQVESNLHDYWETQQKSE